MLIAFGIHGYRVRGILSWLGILSFGFSSVHVCLYLFSVRFFFYLPPLLYSLIVCLVCICQMNTVSLAVGWYVHFLLDVCLSVSPVLALVFFRHVVTEPRCSVFDLRNFQIPNLSPSLSLSLSLALWLGCENGKGVIQFVMYIFMKVRTSLKVSPFVLLAVIILMRPGITHSFLSALYCLFLSILLFFLFMFRVYFRVFLLFFFSFLSFFFLFFLPILVFLSIFLSLSVLFCLCLLLYFLSFFPRRIVIL